MSQDNQAANAVDTSTNEETHETDVEDEDYSDLDLDVEDLQDDEDEETEESEATENDESANESGEDAEEESEEDEAKGQADPEAERKALNDQMAKQRIAERQAREAARKQAEDEALSDVADNPTELAIRQLQLNAYHNTVQSNTDRLVNGYDKAVAHIDLFRTGTPEVIAELDAAIDDFEKMHVTFNKFGDPIEVRGDLFQYLANKAESIRRLTGIREQNQKKAATNTKARTFAPPTRAPKKSKDDDDGFDEVFKDD